MTLRNATGYFKTVDIWNATARTWTASESLSFARTSLAAAVVDGVVLFAGGLYAVLSELTRL